MASSHAISIDVNKPEEINEIFDDITYGKGGSVIRMVNYFLGNDTFFRGITVDLFYNKLKGLIKLFIISIRNILINMFTVMLFKTFYGTH